MSYVLFGSAVVDLVVGASLLFLATPLPYGEGSKPAIRLLRVLVAILGTTLVFALKLPILRLSGVDFFGMIHLVYVDLVVVLPLLGVLVLVAGFRGPGRLGARRLTTSVWLLAAVSLSLATVGFYSSFVEPFRLQVEQATVTLRSGRAGFARLKVGVLADIQTDRVTDYERRAFSRLMELEPDLILVPGDLFQGSHEAFERELPALHDLMKRLSAPGGVFFVLGNTDGNLEQLQRVFEDTAVRLLVNEIVSVDIKDRRVTIGGVPWDSEYGPTVDELQRAPGDDAIRILLAHYPDVLFDVSAGSRIDLVVAGHTHGGQVQLPVIGPPITLSRVPRAIAAGGLHETDGRQIYVSRGLGCERDQAPRIRFLCPPEVSLLTLE